MNDMRKVREFLGAVRRRAFVEAALRVGQMMLAAALTVLAVMALAAARMGPAGFWPGLTGIMAALLIASGCFWGAWRPARLLRSERRIALLVGRRHPPVASDLLSVVELADSSGGASASMTSAFVETVATSVAALDPKRLVPFDRVIRWATGVAALAALLLVAWFAVPTTSRRGLGLLFHHPTRFEGAAIATQPLVGDVHIEYAYPGYTGLPRRTIDGSTGDMVALKGTRVSLTTTPLRSARGALLLLGEMGEGGEIEARIENGKLAASFTIHENGTYRFWLAPLLGRPVRELRAHRIVAESDQPPRVDVRGPADRLALPAPRPVEVGFSASDDFGLGAIDLVYQVGDGPEQRISLRSVQGARSAAGKTTFEPPADALGPGDIVAYHIEAADRDDVSGAKIGASRTLYLVIENPRESLDEQLARERDVLDRLVANLADRLEIATPATDAIAHLAALLAANESEESHLALLGRIIDDERRAGASSKTLIGALAGVADRLGRLVHGEAAALAGLRTKADKGSLGVQHLKRVQAVAGRNVAELETSIVLLDDLISRQRLEDLAAMAKDLTDTFHRLQDLVERYGASKDPALRAQIEREIRDLRSHIEELGQKIAAVKARNEVSTEWQNMPDTKDLMARAQKLDAMLDKGDPDSLNKALSDLGGALGALRGMLDKNAGDFQGERFPQENRAMTELMKKIGDIEGDEQSVAGDGRALAREMEDEHARHMLGQQDKLVADLNAKIARLADKMGGAVPRQMGEAAEDDLKRARDSTKQLQRLLGEKEWGESKKEAERASANLRRVRRAAEDRVVQAKTPLPPAMMGFAKSMGEAGDLAQDISRDLDKLRPGSQDSMSPGQRERTANLAERQQSLRQRTEEVGREAGRAAGQVPGLEKAEPELRGVASQMQESASDMGRGNPQEGANKARDAADRLAQLRDSIQSGRQMGRGRNRQEPVRIPGADESKAPREWRQELMEAMRQQAPEQFRNEVRRYYEELVK